jgi:hypothetical protein
MCICCYVRKPTIFSLCRALCAFVSQGKVVQNQPFDEAVELSSSEYAPPIQPFADLLVHLHPIPQLRLPLYTGLLEPLRRSLSCRSVDEVAEAQDDKKAVPRRGFFHARAPLSHVPYLHTPRMTNASMPIHTHAYVDMLACATRNTRVARRHAERECCRRESLSTHSTCAQTMRAQNAHPPPPPRPHQPAAVLTRTRAPPSLGVTGASPLACNRLASTAIALLPAIASLRVGWSRAHPARPHPLRLRWPHPPAPVPARVQSPRFG